MEPKVKNKPAVRLNEEQLKKLDEIAKEKYRGVSRSKAVAWMIEDEWERGQKDKDSWQKTLTNLGSIENG